MRSVRDKLCLFLLIVLTEAYSDDNDPTTLAEKSIYAHNKVRNYHAVENLEWDEALAESSASYAKLLAAENSLKHSEESKRGMHGENLYKGFDGFLAEKTVADAVFYWYLELKGYDYSNPAPDLERFGHFTAVVWRITNRVGCGIASRELYGGMMTFIVCQYIAQGNVDGLFLSNIMQPRSGAVIPESPTELETPIGCVDIFKKCNLWTGICDQEVFKTLMKEYCKKTCNLC